MEIHQVLDLLFLEAVDSPVVEGEVAVGQGVILVAEKLVALPVQMRAAAARAIVQTVGGQVWIVEETAVLVHQIQ
jgi:hypothetical protein